MKFIVDRNKLLEAMQHTKVMMKRSPWLWANTYRLKVQGDKLHISGTDGTMFITESLQLEGSSIGERDTPFCIHNSLLRAIKTLEQQPLEFIVDEYQLTVRHQYGYFRVPIMDTIYPEAKQLEEKDETIHVRMEAPGLYSQMSKVAFAAADDELRPAMSGVYIEIEPDNINFVASDGRILMRLTKHCQEPNKQTCSFIIPRDIANVILRILPKTGYCELVYLNNLARLVIDDNLTISFACINGKYPNYKAVLPTEFNSVFSVEKKQYLKAIRRLYLFSNWSNSAVKIAIGKAGYEQLTLSSRCIEENEIAQENITCEFIEGPDKFSEGILIRIPFLTRILNVFPSDKVVFNVTDSVRACVLTPQPTSDLEELTALVMPMMQSDTDNFESL